jgi:hypothetical protein
MEFTFLITLGVVLLLFIWGWIGVVMIHHLNLERRIEKLINITNPLPEEEKELTSLREQRMVESGKVASAKWTLFLFMAVIVATIVMLVKYDSLRALLGLDTALEAIWIGVIILGFFCMPTFLGLILASSRADKDLSKLSSKDAA